MDNRVNVSVVIPVFNEEQTLIPLHQQLTEVLGAITQTYQIIFVDDGSQDSSYQVLRDIYQCDSHVQVLRLFRNFGQHQAMMAGLEHATGEVVVTMDADLQHPPQVIPKLLEKIAQGYNVVCTARTVRTNSWMRLASSLLANRVIAWSTGVKLRDYGSNLRAYRRPVVEALRHYHERSTYITALTPWLDDKVAEVEIKEEVRQDGQSRYHFLALLRLLFNVITGFSIRPIQFISLLGIGLSGVGVLIGIHLIIYRILFGEAGSGLTTFVAMLLILFGVQMFAMGLIGEYIGRIYIEVQGRPPYLVREHLVHHDAMPRSGAVGQDFNLASASSEE